MAKRGVPEHPKTLKLARTLGIEPWATVGLLECFWHWCSRYALTGEIRSEPVDIAEGIRYSGDPIALFNALKECGWVKADANGTLYVNDVAQHADNTWKANLKRLQQEFFVPTHKVTTKSPQNHDAVEPKSQLNHDSVTTKSQLSCEPPKPEPEPIPRPKPSQSLGRGVGETSENVPDPGPAGAEATGAPPGKPPDSLDAMVEACIMSLNEATGRRYQASGSACKHLRARIRAAPKAERDQVVRQAILVLEFKASQWLRDSKMRSFLRPETLWGAEHWETYSQEAAEWDESGRPPPVHRNGKHQPETALQKRDRLLVELGVTA